MVWMKSILGSLPSMEKAQVLRKLVGIMLDSSSAAGDRLDAKRSLRRIGNDTIVDTLGEAVEANNDVTVVADAAEVLGFLPPSAEG